MRNKFIVPEWAVLLGCFSAVGAVALTLPNPLADSPENIRIAAELRREQATQLPENRLIAEIRSLRLVAARIAAALERAEKAKKDEK